MNLEQLKTEANKLLELASENKIPLMIVFPENGHKGLHFYFNQDIQMAKAMCRDILDFEPGALR